MTEEQIDLVKKTWKIFRDINPVLVGDVFYSRLFIEVPQVKQMFRISKEEQSMKFIDMINIIIGRLDRLDELTRDIEQLAIRHAGYGVKPSHFKPVGEALLWTLQQGLGKDWTEEIKEAWQTCYKMLSQTMITAMDKKGS